MKHLAKCHKCGSIFDTESYTAILCPHCSRQARENSTLRTCICRECGTEFEGGPRAWYCPECRLERKRESLRCFRKNGPARPLGTTDICVRCGKQYIVTGWRQKYCPDCSADGTKEAVRPHKRRYQQEYSSTHQPQKQAAVPADPKPHFLMISPQGDKFYISNIRAWVRENESRFPPSDVQGEARISRLCASISAACNGGWKAYGWHIEKIKKPEE